MIFGVYCAILRQFVTYYKYPKWSRCITWTSKTLSPTIKSYGTITRGQAMTYEAGFCVDVLQLWLLINYIWKLRTGLRSNQKKMSHLRGRVIGCWQSYLWLNLTWHWRADCVNTVSCPHHMGHDISSIPLWDILVFHNPNCLIKCEHSSPLGFY